MAMEPPAPEAVGVLTEASVSGSVDPGDRARSSQDTNGDTSSGFLGAASRKRHRKRRTERVPPRARRASARPGELSVDVLTALRAETARLSALDDPVAIRVVGDAFAVRDVELADLAQVRLRAVPALRGQGWSDG